MTAAWYGLGVLAVAAACGTAHSPAGPAGCPARIDAIRAEADAGRLGRALRAVDGLPPACAGRDRSRLRAGLLDDLGLDRRAIAAYREHAARFPVDAADASAAIARIDRRPPMRRPDATAEDRARGLALYRDGVARRQAGDHDGALAALRRSYGFAPHPLTVVQIGLVHRAAGRMVEARKAFARALAIAEELTGEPARPVVPSTDLRRAPPLAFSADGKHLAVSISNGVAIWDVTTGRYQQTLPLQCSRLEFLPGERAICLLVGDDGDRPVVHDLRSGRTEPAGATAAELGPAPERPESGELNSPDGTRIARPTEAGLEIVDAGSGDTIRVLGGKAGLASGWDVCPSWRCAAWATETGVGRLDVGRLSRRSLRDGADSVAFAADDSLLIIQAEALLRWRGGGLRKVAPRTRGPAVEGFRPIHRLRRSTDGEWIAESWGEEGVNTLHLFSAADLRTVYSDEFLALGIGDGVVAWSNYQGAIQTAALGLRPRPQPLARDAGRVDQLAVGPRGRVAAILDGADGAPVVRVWQDGRALATIPIPKDLEYPPGIGFSGGGDHVLLAGSDGRIRIGDPGAGRFVGELRGCAYPEAILPHPERDLVAVTCLDRIDLFTTRPAAHVGGLVITGDGAWLVWSADGRVDGGPPDRAGEVLYYRAGELQLPGFVVWDREHTPGLLGALLAQRASTPTPR